LDVSIVIKKYNIKAYKQFLKTIGYSNDKTSRNLFRLFQFAIYAIFLVFFINIFSLGTSSFGEWGDFFGGVLNPILTFLTFMGLLITIIIQKKELKESRDVFIKQQEALEKQQEEMTIQSFDNKFFQMLNSFNEITNALKLNIYQKEYSSKELFEQLVEELKKEIFTKYNEDVIVNDIKSNKIDYIYAIFPDFNNKFDTTFKYYFLNLYQLLKFIDEDIPHKDKDKYSKKYANILRAQLSKNELILLTYNAIGVMEFCGDNYKKLVEKYSFFEHLTYDDYISDNQYSEHIINIINSILKLYDDKVFGENKGIINNIKIIQDDNIPQKVDVKKEAEKISKLF
jgi:hypothetical protein